MPQRQHWPYDARWWTSFPADVARLRPHSAPKREGNGTLPGRFGPWMHMLKVNCRNSADTCNEVLHYVAPKPPNWSPPHRYIFILFEQLRAGRTKKARPHL